MLHLVANGRPGEATWLIEATFDTSRTWSVGFDAVET
jgi:hypothetical protein